MPLDAPQAFVPLLCFCVRALICVRSNKGVQDTVMVSPDVCWIGCTIKRGQI